MSITEKTQTVNRKKKDKLKITSLLIETVNGRKHEENMTMKERIHEDPEIQRIRQFLSSGVDDFDVDDGAIDTSEKYHSIAELIDEIRSEETSDCLDDTLEKSKVHSSRDLEISAGNDLRIIQINERGEIMQLDLWSPKYIRTMTSLSFDFGGPLLWHETLVAKRLSNNRINITYQSDLDPDMNEIKESPIVKTIDISEAEWNLVISYLFNYVKIDLWDNHISCYSPKAYELDGRDYRRVPVCDGFCWHLTVCGERRTHEFSGVCRVPDNWMDFKRLINALEEKTKEPSVELSIHLAAAMSVEKH